MGANGHGHYHGSSRYRCNQRTVHSTSKKSPFEGKTRHFKASGGVAEKFAEELEVLNEWYHSLSFDHERNESQTLKKFE